MEKLRKLRKECTLYNKNIEYVEDLKEKRNLRSWSAALDIIISEHRNNNGDQINAMADIIVKKIETKYSNLFTRLRLGTGTADKNSQIIIEILNSLVFNLEFTKAFTTDVVPTDIILESQDTVKKRIERYKQIKDNKNFE